MYQRYFKRILDITLSLIAIILLSPILLVTAILVKINLGGPIIFKQSRPGLNEDIFTIYKFRTMNNALDMKGELLPDKYRITRFGNFLRATSLDELPELFNIIKGDMSIVGPRPLHVKYLPLYTEIQRKRHNVKPGLTGLAQVNGRNSLMWEEKFLLDIDYVNNISLLKDIKIIFKTFLGVFKKEGINYSENLTMPAFEGSKDEKDN